MSIIYELMNPHFEDIVKMFSKNKPIFEFSSNEIINELKIIAIDEIIKKYSIYSGKHLYNHLLELKNTLNNLIENMTNDIKTNNKIKDKTILNAFIAEMYVTNNIISDMLFEYSKNKKINFIDYLNNIKKSITDPTNKRKRTDDDNENKLKNRKKEYDDNDDSDNENKLKNRKKEYDDNDDNDESDDEDDDDEDDILDDDDDIFDKYSTLDKNVNMKQKENKDFVDEIMKATSNDSNKKLIEFFSKLKNDDKTNILKQFKEINKENVSEKPLLFKFLAMNLPLKDKSYIVQKYLTLCSGGSTKLKYWIDSVVKIPFGINIGIDVKNIKTNKIKLFLDKLKDTMDKAVYGHNEAKRHIIQIMGQQIKNSESKGINLGIYGPPGNGKTSLIKDGISKAMERPFVFISLGGATDASFLEGHSYTYEGSICGRIAQGIIDSKCMNPIIYFDELDKISQCHKGREITNILVHLIDPAQNSHFRDKYFNNLEFDLSKVTFIFSYNDPNLVDRILMDRITQVETKYLIENQKIHIAQKYLLPEITKEIGFNINNMIFSDEIISKIINKYTNEGGVRKLKNILYYILREINIYNLTKTKLNNNLIKFPLTFTEELLLEILKNKKGINPEKIHLENSCGIINGMYATDLGIGGVMPIQVLWTPGEKPFEIKATGNLQLVIKESTEVAATLSFNLLTKEEQDLYIQEWKINPRAIHIHCPDGAVPKDGPSAGTALTVAIYSLLTNKKIKNDIAITGEINLQGHITAIGGLESKLQGAKKAGIKFALYPKENEKDIIEIKERNPTLIDDNLKVQAIEKIEEAIYYSII